MIATRPLVAGLATLGLLSAQLAFAPRAHAFGPWGPPPIPEPAPPPPAPPEPPTVIEEAPASQPVAATPATQPASQPASRPTKKPHARRVAPYEPEPWYDDGWGWVIFTSGTVLLTTGVAFILDAHLVDTDADKATDPSQAKDLHDRASSRRAIGETMGVVGLIGFGIGAIKLAWVDGDRTFGDDDYDDSKEHHRTPTSAPTAPKASAWIVTPTGISVVGHF